MHPPGPAVPPHRQMLAAVHRAAAMHGALCVEEGSEVMALLVLPPAPAPSLLSTGTSLKGGGNGGGAAPEGPAGPGLRLATLHRLARALLEAAATIPIPGTVTSLQLQVRAPARARGEPCWVPGHTVCAHMHVGAGHGASGAWSTRAGTRGAQAGRQAVRAHPLRCAFPLGRALAT